MAAINNDDLVGNSSDGANLINLVNETKSVINSAFGGITPEEVLSTTTYDKAVLEGTGLTSEQAIDVMRNGRTPKSLVEMKAITGLEEGDTVYLSFDGRSGLFEYLVGDYSAEVAADMLEGVYVELDAIAATVGVLKRRLNGYVTPEMFGEADSKSSVESADALAGVLGVDVNFTSIIDISSTVIKQSGANWLGCGGLRRLASFSGDAFPLAYIADIDGWSIDNCNFYSARHGTVTIASSAATDRNACLSIERCNDFNVRNNNFNKYSNAVFYSGCNRFSITGNTCLGDTGKDLSGFEDGTFVPFASYTGTGDILSDQQLGVVTPASTDFIISGNRCFSVGLDIAIGVCIQAYGRTPCIVNGNVISGQNAGIQVYKGTLTDPGTETYQRNVVITNNLITYTYEQGVYVRLCFGCTVQGNIIRKTNMNGVVSETGNPFGGIVTRISIEAFGPISAVVGDVGNLITGNMVLDTGRNSVGAMNGIQVRTESTTVTNNFVAQSEELYGAVSGVGTGVYIADDVVNIDVSSNTIQNFNVGILFGRTKWSNDRRSKITNNKVSNTSLTAISVAAFSGVLISGNQINEYNKGVSVRNSPYTKVISNTFSGGTDAITLGSGNFHTDIDDRSTARIGQTLIIKDNIIDETTNPHVVTETSTVDAKFFARCAIFRGDIVDGMAAEYSRPSGSPETTFNQKSWSLGDTIKNSTPTSGADVVKACTSSGTYGTLSSTTGSIDLGSATLTVNDSSGLAPNVYITIAGVSGVKRVVSIDGLSVILSSVSDATVSVVTVSYATPTFA